MNVRAVGLLLLAVGVLAGCRTGYSLEAYNKPLPVTGMPLSLSGKVTRETHGQIVELPYFAASDVPARPQVRGKDKGDPTINLAVESNLGYLQVLPLYPPFGHVNYGASGRGEAIPIMIKIEAPYTPTSMVPRDSNRRYKPTSDRTFRAPIYHQRNRQQAISLAKEILANTHCRGGRVTEDRSDGPFAEAYDKKTRGVNGLKVVPGWGIKLRCSRWRSKG